MDVFLLNILLCLAYKIFDEENLADKIKNLHDIFRKNGYRQYLVKTSLSNSKKHQQKKEEFRSFACLPYIKEVTDKINHLLKKWNVKRAFSAANKIIYSVCKAKTPLRV